MNVQLYQSQTQAGNATAVETVYLGKWNCLPAPKGEGRYDCKVYVEGKSATLTFVYGIYSQTFVEVSEEFSN